MTNLKLFHVSVKRSSSVPQSRLNAISDNQFLIALHPSKKRYNSEFSGPVQTVGVALKSGVSVLVSGSPHLLWNQEDYVKITAERYLCFNSNGNRLDGTAE